MIEIRESDRDLLRFVWRSEASKPLETYRLTTVPFGLSSSPFLTLRTLLELAKTDGNSFPFARAINENNFHIDDCLCSTPSLEEARQQNLLRRREEIS